jgi:hypothetical protein
MCPCIVLQLKEFFLPLNFEKILWSNKFLKEPLHGVVYLENKEDLVSYETLDFESRLHGIPIIIFWHIVGPHA